MARQAPLPHIEDADGVLAVDIPLIEKHMAEACAYDGATTR